MTPMMRLRSFEVAGLATASGPHRPPAMAHSLSTLVEGEIIPRLVVAHAGDAPRRRPATAGGPVITAADVEKMAPLSLQMEADLLLAHVEGVLARGVSVDSVLVDLLAPAARLLGAQWEADQCDFVDVTMGLWRLQEVAHELAARAPVDHAAADGGRRALFAAMPDDQHSFGAVVIDEVFRRNGWRTDRMSDAAAPDLLHRVADEWFDLVGLTVSCDRHVARVGSVIAALRSVTRNPRLCVMVGGRVFSANPALAVDVGADGTARDAKLALALAETLIHTQRREAVSL